MSLLDRLENESVWELTELNTRKKTFKNDVEDILYGDDYKKYTFNTKEEAEAKAIELKAQGISTNLARVLHM